MFTQKIKIFPKISQEETENFRKSAIFFLENAPNLKNKYPPFIFKLLFKLAQNLSKPPKKKKEKKVLH